MVSEPRPLTWPCRVTRPRAWHRHIEARIDIAGEELLASGSDRPVGFETAVDDLLFVAIDEPGADQHFTAPGNAAGADGGSEVEADL